jgi:calcineurin-like phosphoesterase family protein
LGLYLFNNKKVKKPDQQRIRNINNMKLNIKTNEGCKAYFASDFHLNHQGPRGSTPLWKSRGYNSPSHMTDRIIEITNEHVKANDYLFYVGDWCLDTTSHMFEEQLSRFNCQNIYMVWGNHNSQVSDVYRNTVKKEFNRTDIEVYPIRYRNIVFCGDYLELTVDGTHICMFHYPISVFNKMRHGTYMICGHSHYSYEKTRASCLENRILDVSWDGHLKPLSMKEIRDIMAKKGMVSVDHH